MFLRIVPVVCENFDPRKFHFQAETLVLGNLQNVYSRPCTYRLFASSVFHSTICTSLGQACLICLSTSSPPRVYRYSSPKVARPSLKRVSSSPKTSRGRSSQPLFCLTSVPHDSRMFPIRPSTHHRKPIACVLLSS